MSSDAEEDLGTGLPTQTDTDFLNSHGGDESGQEEDSTDPSKTTDAGLPNNLLQSPSRETNTTVTPEKTVLSVKELAAQDQKVQQLTQIMQEFGTQAHFEQLNAHRKKAGKDLLESQFFPSFHHLRAFTVALTTENFRKDFVVAGGYQEAITFYRDKLGLGSEREALSFLCNLCDSQDRIFGQPQNLLRENYPEGFYRDDEIFSSDSDSEESKNSQNRKMRSVSSSSQRKPGGKKHKQQKDTGTKFVDEGKPQSTILYPNRTTKFEEEGKPQSSILSTAQKATLSNSSKTKSTKMTSIPRKEHASARQFATKKSTTVEETSAKADEAPDSYWTKDVVKASLLNAQKTVQTSVPTFTQVDALTRQALLAGKITLRDDGLRDRFAGRRKKTQVNRPWVFSHQPPDDENRDANGVAQPCNYSIHQLIDTGGDFDHLQSQLPHEIKFLLGGNDHKTKNCLIPGAGRFWKGFAGRMLAILDFRLKIFPVENHGLTTLSKTLAGEYAALTPAQKLTKPHLTMTDEIEKVQRALLFTNAMAIEETIDLSQFSKLERGNTLHDAVEIEKLHRRKAKSRPIKNKDTLLNTTDKTPVLPPIVKKTVEKEIWNATQSLASKVLGWNPSLTFTPNMKKFISKRKGGKDHRTSSKRPRDDKYPRNVKPRGPKRESRRDRERRKKRKADAEKKRKAKQSPDG